MLQTRQLLSKVSPNSLKTHLIGLSEFHDKAGLTTTFNFDPSPETQATIEMARNFTKDHIIPKASSLDQSGEVSCQLSSKKMILKL